MAHHREHPGFATIGDLIKKQEELEDKFTEAEVEANAAQIDLHEAIASGAHPFEIHRLQSHYDALQRRADNLQEQLGAVSEAIWRNDWNGYMKSI